MPLAKLRTPAIAHQTQIRIRTIGGSASAQARTGKQWDEQLYRLEVGLAMTAAWSFRGRRRLPSTSSWTKCDGKSSSASGRTACEPDKLARVAGRCRSLPAPGQVPARVPPFPLPSINFVIPTLPLTTLSLRAAYLYLPTPRAPYQTKPIPPLPTEMARKTIFITGAAGVRRPALSFVFPAYQRLSDSTSAVTQHCAACYLETTAS